MTDLDALPTPSLLLDRERLDRNLARIGGRVRALGARLRPHIKTHKCVEVARRQVAAGEGLTVSTLAEARDFAAAGFRDITYAVPIERGKFAAVTALAAQGVRLGVITDAATVPGPLGEAARAAGVTLDTWVKVDCGYHRCGVDPEGPLLAELAERIGERTHLRFAGLLTHAGHSYKARGTAALVPVARQERTVMVAAAARLAARGIAVPAVSIGSTPTAAVTDALDGVHEVRAGNYAFFDGMQVAIGSCTADDPALTVLAAVVHHDLARGQLILDAGAIALSKDTGIADADGMTHFGAVCDLAGRPLGLRLTSLSQEHGVVAVPGAGPGRDAAAALRVGDRVRVLANHSCLTAAQHAEYVVHAAGRVEDRWPILRGW